MFPLSFQAACCSVSSGLIETPVGSAHAHARTAEPFLKLALVPREWGGEVGWAMGVRAQITMTQRAGPGLGRIFKSRDKISSQPTLALDRDPRQSGPGV